MSLILCSHLLPDVERVCDQVIVLNQGQVAARGAASRALTGARRSMYDVRVKGDERRVPHRPQRPGLRVARGRRRLPGPPAGRDRAGADLPHRAGVRRAGAPPAPAAPRRWRTCSCARSATRSGTDADLRAGLPALRGARRRCGGCASGRSRARRCGSILVQARVPRAAGRGLDPLRGACGPDLHRYATSRRPTAAAGRTAASSASSSNGSSASPCLLSIFGGAGLVANDLRTGAILVYLSRPLTRRDYVLGKLRVLLALNLSVTLVPGPLLYADRPRAAPAFLQVGAGLDRAGGRRPRAARSASSVSLLALAVPRSLEERAGRRAGALRPDRRAWRWCAWCCRRGVPPEPAMLLSLQDDLQAMGNGALRHHGPACGACWVWPALVLVLVALGCLAILRSRVRAVEIVSDDRAAPRGPRVPARLALVRARHRAQRRHDARWRPGVTGLLGPERRGQVHVPEAGAGQLAPSQGEVTLLGRARLGLAGAVPSRGPLPRGRRVLGAPHRPRSS